MENKKIQGNNLEEIEIFQGNKAFQRNMVIYAMCRAPCQIPVGIAYSM